MMNINFCANCHSENIETFNSTMDDFVIRRMQGSVINNHGPCLYIHCLDCDYGGSSYRFTREEEDRYYHEYMKPNGDYTNDRGCHGEAELLNSKEYIHMRRDTVVNILSKQIDLNSITSVIDFGGNTGDMFPLELNHADRYVVDIESRILSNSVRSISNPSESGLVDLIICSHTLEHVSDARGLIEEIKTYLKPNGWLYIEVPAETVGIFNHGHNFHEHINHYTPLALENTLAMHGFDEILYSQLDYPIYIGVAYAGVGKMI